MNRRSFISTLLGAGAALALEEAIPFNRVWFFPQRIRVANVAVDWGFGKDTTAIYFLDPPRYILTPEQSRELEEGVTKGWGYPPVLYSDYFASSFTFNRNAPTDPASHLPDQRSLGKPKLFKPYSHPGS